MKGAAKGPKEHDFKDIYIQIELSMKIVNV